MSLWLTSLNLSHVDFVELYQFLLSCWALLNYFIYWIYCTLVSFVNSILLLNLLIFSCLTLYSLFIHPLLSCNFMKNCTLLFILFTIHYSVSIFHCLKHFLLLPFYHFLSLWHCLIILILFFSIPWFTNKNQSLLISSWFKY